MADLTDIQSSGSTKIVGSDAVGLEQTAVQSTTSGALHTNLRNASGVEITSASNGNAGKQTLHTATPDTTTATTVLASLNAAVSISMEGLNSVGFQILTGSLIGTLTPECSIDGGTTWVPAAFFDPSNSAVSNNLVFTIANTTKVLSILPIGGASNIRVRVSAFTSGTANSLLRASGVTGAAGAITSAAFSTVTNAAVSLTVNTVTLALSANINRKYAHLSNNSGSSIAIQFGSPTGLTSLTRGLIIPSGQSLFISGDRLYTGSIYAYTNSGSVILAVAEGSP